MHKGPRALISRVPLQAATRRDLLFLHPSACGHTTPSGRPAIAAPEPRIRARGAGVSVRACGASLSVSGPTPGPACVSGGIRLSFVFRV